MYQIIETETKTTVAWVETLNTFKRKDGVNIWAPLGEADGVIVNETEYSILGAPDPLGVGYTEVMILQKSVQEYVLATVEEINTALCELDERIEKLEQLEATKGE